MDRRTILAYIGGVVSAAVVLILLGAGDKVTSPTGTAPGRYVYYPGTEALEPDEIRITACGTGLPAARRGQAASCFLFELGNGDKFFLGHLHSDHAGNFAAWPDVHIMAGPVSFSLDRL